MVINNYIKITARKLWRNRLHSIIHILGLTIGLTSCLLIFLYIKHELSFDKEYPNADKIYRITQKVNTPQGEEKNAVVPYPFGAVAEEELSDLGTTTMIHHESESVVVLEDKKFIINNVIFADSSFFRLFDFEVLAGDPIKDLNNPASAFVTKEWAEKMFEDEDPIGKTFSLNNNADFQVVGLIAEAPKNTHLPYEMIVSYKAFNKGFIGGIDVDWGTTSRGFCYIKLNDENNPESVIGRLEKFNEKYLADEEDYQNTLVLQPISDIHFNQEFAEWNPGYTIDTTYLTSLGLIGLLILSIACINFINLATALALRKSKEVGVRKTLGASKGHIIIQFLGEAFILTSVSMLLSIGLVERILPKFNSFLDREIQFNLGSDLEIIYMILALLVFVTLLAGLYPSLTLARFNVVKVLKAKLTTHDKSSLVVRRGLVIFQFVIAQVLIIGTIVISAQMSYFQERPLGFSKDHMVHFTIPAPNEKNLSALEARLQGIPGIKQLSFCIGAPSTDNNLGTNFTTPELKDKEHFSVSIKAVDRAYLEIYELELIAGRWMTEGEERQAELPFDKDPSYVLVVNEALVKRLGYSEPEEILGKELMIGLGQIQTKVIGVVKDFHMASMKAAIEPVVLLNFPFFYYNFAVKMDATDMQSTIASIEEQWNEVFPDYLFEYIFIDEYITSLYEEETRLFTLIQIFSGLSIFIGSIGLIGLISFIVVQRMKEIGVRKVLGASVTKIIFGLANEFIILEFIAFIITVPLCYFTLKSWLGEFAYRIDLSPWFFISGLILSLIIAFLTVSIQSIRAATANPVDALKDE